MWPRESRGGKGGARKYPFKKNPKERELPYGGNGRNERGKEICANTSGERRNEGNDTGERAARIKII